MSQQMQEKNVAQEDAAIAIPDADIVSINYIFSFHFILLLIYLYFISRHLPPIPQNQKQQKAWQEHAPQEKM